MSFRPAKVMVFALNVKSMPSRCKAPFLNSCKLAAGLGVEARLKIVLNPSI